MSTDVVLNLDKGYHDISFTTDGDIATASSLDTLIRMSILEEVRATRFEIPEANLRRGWIGNESLNGFEQGSKAWLFDQERVTGTTLAELGTIIRNALQFLIIENIATRVIVNAPIYRNSIVSVNVELFYLNSEPDNFYFELWKNTG